MRGRAHMNPRGSAPSIHAVCAAREWSMASMPAFQAQHAPRGGARCCFAGPVRSARSLTESGAPCANLRASGDGGRGRVSGCQQAGLCAACGPSAREETKQRELLVVVRQAGLSRGSGASPAASSVGICGTREHVRTNRMHDLDLACTWRRRRGCAAVRPVDLWCRWLEASG